MKASRLLSILMLLQARGRLSAHHLAQAMEVSVRTVLRDIDQLSAAGVPIWGGRGRLGGFQLREGWSSSLTGLTEPEASALFLSGLPNAAAALGLGAAARSARLKMVASLPPEWRDQADRVADRLHIDPLDWYRSAETPACLRDMADAVWRGTRVEVAYESWNGLACHTLEPLGLVCKAGTWYAVARKSGQTKALTFRLANIRQCTLVQQPFKRPRVFDLAAHWQATMAQFELGLHPMAAQIAVSPRGVTWLANARTPATPWPGHPGQAVTGLAGVPPGWQAFLLPIESLEHGARKILGFGEHAKVLGPEALLAQMRRELKATQALYGRARRDGPGKRLTAAAAAAPRVG